MTKAKTKLRAALDSLEAFWTTVNGTNEGVYDMSLLLDAIKVVVDANRPPADETMVAVQWNAGNRILQATSPFGLLVVHAGYDGDIVRTQVRMRNRDVIDLRLMAHAVGRIYSRHGYYPLLVEGVEQAHKQFEDREDAPRPEAGEGQSPETD